MHWRLSETSAIGVVGASQIEIAPNAPGRGANWHITKDHAARPVAAWQFAAVQPTPPHSGLPQEVYSRQNDLIVRYDQGPSELFSYQLDWRLLEPAAPFVAAIELWLSVQTELLDTQPELEITCSAPDGVRWSSFEHQQLVADDQELATAAPVAVPTAKGSSASVAAHVTGSHTTTPPNGAVAMPDAARGPAVLLCSWPATADRAGAQGVWLIEPTDQCHARRCTADEQSQQRVRLFGHFMEKGVIRRARMRFLLADHSDAHAALTKEQVIAAYRDLANSPLPLTA